MNIVAYCNRSGAIGFAPTCPEDALPLISGPESWVREAVEGASRRGYDGTTLLVPGVPEAGKDDCAAMRAVKVFHDQLWKEWEAHERSRKEQLATN